MGKERPGHLSCSRSTVVYKSDLVSLLSQVAVALCDDEVIETLLTTEGEDEIFTLFNRKGEME